MERNAEMRMIAYSNNIYIIMIKYKKIKNNGKKIVIIIIIKIIIIIIE